MKLRLMMLLAALCVSGAAAQDMVDRLHAATKIEIQEAAAFTDGVVVPCPSLLNFDPADFHVVCVDVSETPWTAAQLRDWSDYGLSQWRVFTAWSQKESVWNTVLMHLGRNEMMIITIVDSMRLVIYGASIIE